MNLRQEHHAHSHSWIASKNASTRNSGILPRRSTVPFKGRIGADGHAGKTACRSGPLQARKPASAARVTQYAAFCTFSILCSDFGTSFASHAMAPARVFSLLPSGNSIGSSKRRDQDTTQLHKFRKIKTSASGGVPLGKHQ